MLNRVFGLIDGRIRRFPGKRKHQDWSKDWGIQIWASGRTAFRVIPPVSERHNDTALLCPSCTVQ